MLFQQFLVGADEAEGWLNEKTTLACSDEVGDTLAAVQVSTEYQIHGVAIIISWRLTFTQSLLKKHELFESEVKVHQERVAEIETVGNKLVHQV